MVVETRVLLVAMVIGVMVVVVTTLGVLIVVGYRFSLGVEGNADGCENGGGSNGEGYEVEWQWWWWR